MILPTKRVTEDRALLTLGGEVLLLLKEPKTVSRLWSELSNDRRKNTSSTPLTFDWFVLALDFLYALGVISLSQGLVRKQDEQ